MKNVYHHHIDRVKVGLPPERGKVKLFPQEAQDDEWMAFVAAQGWIVFTQDYALHHQPAVVSIIKQHGAKVFYLWGAEATKFEAMRVLTARLAGALEIAATSNGPFIYRMKPRGRFDQVPIP